ncbi:class I SAM-dependent DNA methyltransferase [Caldalkalibacillus mannanilyticus]|uniref:class I SAM-dependent DNA methyltransferase n=1 Tax=Caldalkalibacillus mannanilyticus TaxID=1418 RepID=UPI00046AC848|nr:class I SAM-dependent methyltransferase [Caldalkalibacillus mannanilyticus]
MGLEFVELFDNWAEVYDESVTGKDFEYKEVFSNYEMILDTVCEFVSGHVVEFGVGTGNLTQKLLDKGYHVTGFEPSSSMMRKAKEKLSEEVSLFNGDFITFYTKEPMDAFVSTYAFHHLTDAEKAEAISKYSSLLSKGGKVVFADTVFIDEVHKQKYIAAAKDKGFFNLAQDLETEYYTTIPTLEKIFNTHGFFVQFKRLNTFVWLIDATKL